MRDRMGKGRKWRAEKRNLVCKYWQRSTRGAGLSPQGLLPLGPLRWRFALGDHGGPRARLTCFWLPLLDATKSWAKLVGAKFGGSTAMGKRVPASQTVLQVATHERTRFIIAPECIGALKKGDGGRKNK